MVTELRKSFQFDIEVVKRPEANKLGRASLPKFPAMEIDDELFFEDRVTSLDEMSRELERRNAPRA